MRENPAAASGRSRLARVEIRCLATAGQMQVFDGTLVQSIQRRRCELWTRFYPRRTLTAINRDGMLRFLRAN